MKVILCTVVLLMFISAGNAAEDRLEIDGSSITGIKEAPKAMYVVPWRPVMPVEMEGVEIKSLIDNELEMLDRNAFQRRIELFDLTSAARP